MFKRFMTDEQVERRYVQAGAVFGCAVSYIYMGECVDFKKLLAKWGKWEQIRKAIRNFNRSFKKLLAKWGKWEAEYAKRGYRTLPLDDFVAYGGYGTPLKGLGEKRAEGEKIVLHAKIYREVYLGKIRPAVNLSELMKPLEPNESPEARAQVGTYFVPSTKKAE